MGKQSTHPATTQPVDDLDIAGRLIGRGYTREERELMRAGLERTTQALAALRSRDIAPGVEPAITFDPIPAGKSLKTGPMIATRFEHELSNDDSDLAFASVGKLATMLRAGRVTSVQLTTLCLDRLKRHGPTLFCVVSLTEEVAMEQAKRADAELANGKDRGPLHGIPYGAKDLLSTKRYPTTFGVSPYREQIFEQDATVIRRLEEAGAVLVAKLSLGELAMGDVWFGGTTRNPWNIEEGSSGSSAGSCSAVAAGLVPFAIGSETLGSIVSPSVRCGTTALRPTFGRVPRTGAMPLARTMDKLGPITRRAEDLALVLAAMAGPDGEDPTCHDAAFEWPTSRALKVGYDTAAFTALGRLQNQEVKDLYTTALERCKEMFGELQAVELPRDRLLSSVAMATVEVESAESFTELLEAGGLGELVQQADESWPNTFRRATMFPAVDYLRAQRVRRQFMQQMHDALADVDVFVTVPRLSSNLLVTNLTGHPCCLVRVGIVGEGAARRPHQIEFVGQLYGEDALLTVAHRFEETVATRTDWPREAFA